MTVRRASPKDLGEILSIYAHARAFMREHGNPAQWGENYPPEQLVRDDISRGECYLVEEGMPVGVFSFRLGRDETYGYIEGQWLRDGPYGTLHRLAGNGRAKGVFAAALAFCTQQCSDLRADTHADNAVMQHLLETHGFVRCGVIYVGDGTPRLAYQKLC